MKKLKIKHIIFILILIIIVLIIVKTIHWNYKINHSKKIVKLKTNEIEVYTDNIRVKDIIKEMNGKLLTNPKIDTNEIGIKKITFKYKTDEGYPVKYKLNVNIVDSEEPYITKINSKTIYTDYDKELEKEFFCGDNYDKNPKCVIEGDYDIKSPGSYNLIYKGEDQSGNIAKTHFTLYVKERPKVENNSNDNNVKEEKNYTYFKELKEEYTENKLKFGIDVSHWQEDIDFNKVKKAGVDFVYIRVGRGDGIGNDYVLDNKFKRNIEGFNKVNIPVGVYFYSNANSINDAKKEAKWIIKQIKKYKVDKEVVFDWENWSSFQDYDLSFHDLIEMNNAFNEVLEKNGYNGMLYASKFYLETIFKNPKGNVWLAHYTKNTDYKGNYNVWQLCDNGYVDGINGEVDLDIMYQ